MSYYPKPNEVPIEPYLVKYALKNYPTYQFQGQTVICTPKKITMSGDVLSEEAMAKYLDNRRKKYGFALFEMNTNTVQAKYLLVHFLRIQFFMECMFFVKTAVSLGLKAAWAIRKFYAKYNLSDDDYLHDTMYSTWTRYKRGAFKIS